MPDFLQPKDQVFTTLNGEEKTYVLSRFPAIAGRAIVAGYPLTGLPKMGDYGANEKIMLQLMCYVGVYVGDKGEVLPLKTAALVNNHVPDYETLVRIEIEMMRYNTSFFQKGEISTLFADTAKKLIQSISPTLTASLEQFLQATKQRLNNYRQNIP